MAPTRKEQFADDYIYHIYSRSIAKFKIFNSKGEFGRFVDLMNLLRYENFEYSFSRFAELSASYKKREIDKLMAHSEKTIDILAYCLMPTHFHFILKQRRDGGITQYMMRLLNGYSRYFNIKHQRSGPLWSSRFKSVIVEDDEQLLHLSRYIHLNPTSAGLVENPEDWQYSSYNEYLSNKEFICSYKKNIVIDPAQYKKFTNDRKEYQKDLSKIKLLLIENYSG